VRIQQGMVGEPPTGEVGGEGTRGNTSNSKSIVIEGGSQKVNHGKTFRGKDRGKRARGCVEGLSRDQVRGKNNKQREGVVDAISWKLGLDRGVGGGGKGDPGLNEPSQKVIPGWKIKSQPLLNQNRGKKRSQSHWLENHHFSFPPTEVAKV